jgi:hypothetical protein
MEDAPKDKVLSVEDCPVLKEFENVFKEISGLPPKRDIDFSINLMTGVAPVSIEVAQNYCPESHSLCQWNTSTEVAHKYCSESHNLR